MSVTCTEIHIGKTKQSGMLISRERKGSNAKRNNTVLKGKLCGANHLALNPAARKKNSESCKLNYRRRDPFYMVDGIEIEECFIDPINTDSGVITMSELEML